MNTYKQKIKLNMVKTLNTPDKEKIMAKLNAKRLES